MEDDRSLLQRALVWVEEKCPWLHFVLLPVLTAAGIALLIAASRTWHGVAEGAFLRLLMLGVITAAGGYGAYAMRVWKARKAPNVLIAKVVGARRETYRVRYHERSKCYLAFKPLDGSAYIELRVPETEMNRFSVGEIGVLRYREGEYVSFMRQAANAMLSQEQEVQ